MKYGSLLCWKFVSMNSIELNEFTEVLNTNQIFSE